jgi:IclR family KDG regulon transcriptional repressor
LTESIRAVERALDILLCFTSERPKLSLTQIADIVGMNKSTVHRLLLTLEGKNFLHRESSTGLYKLGYRFVDMASIVINNVDIQRFAQPYLERLAEECGETVDLAILDGSEIIYLQVIESRQRVKLAAAVGQRLPVYCTASGKAFLAYLPDEEVQAILGEGMIRYTENTLITIAEIRKDIEQTRERGFAISQQELENFIHAIAAPILNAHRVPVAVIAIAGPSFRLPGERMLELGQLLCKTTDAIARDAGIVALTEIVSKTFIPGHIPQPISEVN